VTIPVDNTPHVNMACISLMLIAIFITITIIRLEWWKRSESTLFALYVMQNLLTSGGAAAWGNRRGSQNEL
jgi:hypothetical protein